MKKLKTIIKHILHLPIWLIAAVFVISFAVSVYSLRSNNQHMVKLRNELYAADKTGKGINEALNELRSYVYAHMNTNLTGGNNAIKPPIQLKYSYERLQAAEQQRIDSVNSNVYTDAQNYCQALNPTGFSGRGRVPCVQDYVATHGVKAQTIPPELYQYDFVSPLWSPDLAGWSLLVTLLLFIILVTRALIYRLVRANIKSQQI